MLTAIALGLTPVIATFSHSLFDRDCDRPLAVWLLLLGLTTMVLGPMLWMGMYGAAGATASSQLALSMRSVLQRLLLQLCWIAAAAASPILP